MPDLELSEAAQHWFNVVLIWIGFGTLAGLLARSLMPGRDPAGAVAVITLGIIGSVAGPLALSYALGSRAPNPLGPAGLLAATAGALLLMVVYRLVAHATRRDGPDDPP